jgi:hypothetical protein
MVTGRRGPPQSRPVRPREDERRQLAARWEENYKRRKAGSPSAAIQAIDEHFAKLRTKVQNWNRKPGKDDKVSDVKDISGADVMEVLALAFALTNDAAYEADREAMRLHRLDKGGLRRAFGNLQKRHGHDQAPDFYYSPDIVDGQQYNIVQQYMDEFGFKSRRAIEHVVADLGMQGTSFADAVDKARKAYEKREVHEAERQQYLEELSGLRDPNNSR